MYRKFFSSSKYLACVVFFLLLSASPSKSVTSPASTSARIDQDQLAFIGTFPLQPRNLTIRNVNSTEPVVHVSLDKTDLLENDSDKMISQDQIVFASQGVQDFGDFQIPAGGKVVISVSIVANPVIPSEPGTYKGKILVVIPNSTELTVPIAVDLKPSGIQILCSTITLCAMTEPDTMSYLLAKLPTSTINFFFSVIGVTGIIGFFSFYITYRGAVNANSAETRATRQDAEREEDRERELEANSKNKLNIDLKYRIYRVDKKGFIVILPAIENIGANNVNLLLAEDITKGQEANSANRGGVRSMIQSNPQKGTATELSIEACDSISNLKFLKGGQPVTFVKWTGEECTGSNSLLRKGEKMPPNEKFVEFTGNGIFKVKLVVTNEGEHVAWPAEVYGSTAETPPTPPKPSPGPNA